MQHFLYLDLYITLGWLTQYPINTFLDYLPAMFSGNYFPWYFSTSFFNNDTWNTGWALDFASSLSLYATALTLSKTGYGHSISQQVWRWSETPDCWQWRLPCRCMVCGVAPIWSSMNPQIPRHRLIGSETSQIGFKQLFTASVCPTSFGW